MEGQILRSLTPEPFVDSIIFEVESVIDMSFDEEGSDGI